MTEMSLNRQFAQPAEYLGRFETCARTAIAARADPVIPAEGVVAATAATNGLHEVDGRRCCWPPSTE